jgi:hypothetical protein
MGCALLMSTWTRNPTTSLGRKFNGIDETEELRVSPF